MFRGKVQINVNIAGYYGYNSGSEWVGTGCENIMFCQIPEVFFVKQCGLVRVKYGYSTGLKSTHCFCITLCLRCQDLWRCSSPLCIVTVRADTFYELCHVLFLILFVQSVCELGAGMKLDLGTNGRPFNAGILEQMPFRMSKTMRFWKTRCFLTKPDVY